MDKETETHLKYISKGIDEIKDNQHLQWDEINKNGKSISRLKGWVAGLIGAGTLGGIVAAILKSLGKN